MLGHDLALVAGRREWAARICQRWQESVEAIIDVGRLLLEAKAALPGEFQAMVEGDLAFGSRTARMLMAVAVHPLLADRNHGSALPPSWRTLYELSRLPRPVLVKALADGTITPEMERSEAEALAGGVSGASERDRREHNRLIRSSSESFEWYTPVVVVEAAREVLGGIDIDPASCAMANETVMAARYFTADDDGLKHDWPGRVWLNPPYGGGRAGAFVEQLLGQVEKRITTSSIVLLSGNSTDTGWFRPLFDFPICFAGRIDFIAPGGEANSSPPHGSVCVYVGPDVDRFVRVFEEFGPVVGRIDGRSRRRP
jgi:phage N-6-adenine-methyltransferase